MRWRRREQGQTKANVGCNEFVGLTLEEKKGPISYREKGETERKRKQKAR